MQAQEQNGTELLLSPCLPVLYLSSQPPPLKTDCGAKGFPGAISVELKYKRVNIRTTIKLAITYQGFAVCLPGCLEEEEDDLVISRFRSFGVMLVPRSVGPRIVLPTSLAKI